MTREAINKVRDLLGEIDDIIYRDARSRVAEGGDYTLTEDEVKLTTIIDEAQGQVMEMKRAFG